MARVTEVLKRAAKSEPPRNDDVPREVERVAVWHENREIAQLFPLPPPPVGELVSVNGQLRRVLDRRYDAETREARVLVA